MRFLKGKRVWHIARAYGYRRTVPEADFLCGRSVVGADGYIYSHPYPEPICRRCSAIARHFGWM